MPPLSTTTQSFLPLTPVVYEILLSLADDELHGYAIMQEIEERTEGRTTMRPGTLYRAVDRLLASGLIEESDRRPDPQLDDERRRYYRLTTLGRAVLTAEAERLARAVAAARAKKLVKGRA
jgi:DNA-binding PadR family transcriptional regulator